MHFIEKLTTTITYVVSLLTLSPFDPPGTEKQAPLLSSNDQLVTPNDPSWSHTDPWPPLKGQNRFVDQVVAQEPSVAKGPVFKPPTGRLKGPGSDFQCDYSKMHGFRSCSNSTNRGCWLTNDNGTQYDITTNYEDTNKTPIGIHRNYTLNLTDSWVNADGMNFTYAKLFNNSYPGPWIQACWGDVRKKAMISTWYTDTIVRILPSWSPTT